MVENTKSNKTKQNENSGEVGYKKLFVWQKADEFARNVYLVTKNFPKDEIFGVTSQLRRAALSIPTNIVEGAGRQNKGELKQFINIALGSTSEAEYLIEFSKHLDYLSDDDHRSLISLKRSLGSILWKFYKAL